MSINITRAHSDEDLFFLYLDPYFFANMGVGISIALSVISAAWGIALTGTSLTGAAVGAPRIRTKNMISIIFCEALGIYGLIISIIIQLKTHAIDPNQAFMMTDYFAGIALFWAGVVVGFTNLCTGIAVGISGSSTALADAANPEVFIRLLIVEIFASALGLFGLIVSVILANSAPVFGKGSGVV